MLWQKWFIETHSFLREICPVQNSGNVIFVAGPAFLAIIEGLGGSLKFQKKLRKAA